MAFVAILIILSIGLSRNLEEDQSVLSLKLYPLNFEAAFNKVYKNIDHELSKEELKSLEENIIAFLPTHAGDARLYSLLGEIKRLYGEQDESYTAFDRALQISKTEVNALLWTIWRLIDEGKELDALERLDVLFRRWPARITPLAPFVAEVFSQEDYYEKFLQKLNTNPPWRQSLINVLSRSPETMFLAAHLLQDLAKGETLPSNTELSTIIAQLIHNKQYSLAYQTFLITLNSADKEVNGYIHNSRFIRPLSGRFFDWQVANHTGIKIKFASQQDSGINHGAQLTFNNTPVRRLSFDQYIALPPGMFQLSFDVSSQKSKLPKGLLWQISCLENNKKLAEVNIDPGTYLLTSKTTTFTIPSDKCQLQSLQLITKAIGENWNDRYSGNLMFDNISIIASDL